MNSPSPATIGIKKTAPPERGGPLLRPFEAMEGVPKHVHRTMWMSIYEGSLTLLFINWTTGAVLSGYLLYHNATPLQLAMAGSLPLLCGVMAPLTVIIQALWPRPLLIVTLMTVIGRGIWLTPAILPFLDVPAAAMALYILYVVGISSLFQSMAGAIWTAWMGAVIPEERRGRYFGLRNGIHSIVGLLASLSAGLFLDSVGPPLNFQVVLFCAVIAAFGGIYLYGKHYEPPLEKQRIDIKAIVMEPLRDRNFRRFLRFVGYWQASVFLSAPFVYPYFISVLGLPFVQIALYQTLAAVTTLVMAPLWGRLADIIGNKAILAFSTIGAGFFLPITWMLATPGSTTIIYISGIVDGLFWSAVNPAIFNLSLATAPQNRRLSYISVVTMVSGLCGFAGGLASAPLLGFFSHESLQYNFAGYAWTQYHWIFMISMAFRSMAFLLVSPVKETRSWTTLQVIRALSFRFVGFFWRSD